MEAHTIKGELHKACVTNGRFANIRLATWLNLPKRQRQWTADTRLNDLISLALQDQRLRPPLADEPLGKWLDAELIPYLRNYEPRLPDELFLAKQAEKVTHPARYQPPSACGIAARVADIAGARLNDIHEPHLSETRIKLTVEAASQLFREGTKTAPAVAARAVNAYRDKQASARWQPLRPDLQRAAETVLGRRKRAAGR